MKAHACIGERYCPAKGQNVPVQIWWDQGGNRQESCLRQGCQLQSGSFISPCSKQMQGDFSE